MRLTRAYSLAASFSFLYVWVNERLGGDGLRWGDGLFWYVGDVWRSYLLVYPCWTLNERVPGLWNPPPMYILSIFLSRAGWNVHAINGKFV